MHSPTIAKIEVTTLGDVRRAKLYYLRERHGKAAKIKERRVPRAQGRGRCGRRRGRRSAEVDDEVDELEELTLDDVELTEGDEALEAEGDDGRRWQRPRTRWTTRRTRLPRRRRDE